MRKYKKNVNKQWKTNMALGLILSLIILFIYLSISYITVNAQGANDYSRMLQDAGENSGGGGSTYEKIQERSRNTFKTLLDLFRTPGSTAGDGNPSPGGGTNISGSPNPTGEQGEPKYPKPENTGNTGEAQLGDKIASLANQFCNYINPNTNVSTRGVIANTNYSCLTNFGSVLAKAAKDEMQISAVNYRFVQCVACARAFPKAMNRYIYNGVGNAKQHIDQDVSGYTYFSNTPSNYQNLVPGVIGINGTGAYGHIFYITEVYRDSSGRPTKYKAFECNYGASGLVRHNVIRPLDSYLAGWQKPNSL